MQMNNDELLWKVTGLKKYFATPQGMLHAVDDVSFTIRRGCTLGVVGESGCGKSTLGRVMLRLHDASAGQALFENRDIVTISSREVKALRRDMQMIFQDPYASLNPRMSIGDIIGEPMKRNNLLRKRKDREARTLELMDTVGLARRLINSYPHELDGGRRQRVGIARALSVGPKFVVCDEPVSALDVSIRAQILNLMQDLQEQLNLTYLFITHDLSVVKHISDDIMVMYLGQIVEKAPAEKLFAQPLHYYTRALLAAIPSYAKRHKPKEIIHGELTSPVEPPPGCRFAVRCPAADDLCRSVTPPLAEQQPGHFVACHHIPAQVTISSSDGSRKEKSFS